MKPDDCCHGYCRTCPHSRRADTRRGQPLALYCRRCDATTYRDSRGRCIPCQADTPCREGGA